ncbi:MAG: alpha/beta hydrolase [Sphingomicrobium sp.]
MKIERRTFLAAAGSLAVAPKAIAAGPANETFPIWNGAPPGGPRTPVKDEFVFRSGPAKPDDIAWTHVAVPTLTVTRPARPNGGAVLVIPGGGYARVALSRGGSGQAADLAALGYTAFDLRYRLAHDGWAAGPDAPLQDAQRAMRLIRAGAKRWGIDPAHVTAMGFSAGGHLAARLGSRHSLKSYDARDTADRLSARPTVLGLFFPVVKMEGPAAHGQSKRELLGATADPARMHIYSADTDLPADMPPSYLACCADDPVVPPANSLAMFNALQSAHIPSELMVFERGGHGFPKPGPDGKPYPWLDLFLRFATRHGSV